METLTRARKLVADDSMSESLLKIARCNEEAIRYFSLTKYSSDDVLKVGAAMNEEWMFAIVNFKGQGQMDFTVSQKTWERQEGHYPTIMGLCQALSQSEDLFPLVGSVMIWLEDGMWPWLQHHAWRVPIFAFGKDVSDRQTLLIPDPAYLGSAGYVKEKERAELASAEIPWSKRIPATFWRGAATGGGMENVHYWESTPRGRLVLKAKEISDYRILDARITKIGHLPDEMQETLLDAGVLSEEVPFEHFFNYRYLVDADGYHCAWKSLFMKLISGSVVLKIESPLEQWYHRELVPWKHYIPLARDLGDFRQVAEWLRAHDREARQIALDGAEAARKITFEKSVREVVAVFVAALNCQK